MGSRSPRLPSHGRPFGFAVLPGREKAASFVHGTERGSGAGKIVVGCEQQLGIPWDQHLCQCQSAPRPESSAAPAAADACCLLSGVSQSYANKPFKKMNYLDQAVLERIAPDPARARQMPERCPIFTQNVGIRFSPGIFCVFHVVCLLFLQGQRGR